MQITINQNYHNSRVDRFIREHFNIPQSLVARLIREKKIKVNRKKIEISSHLAEGDIVSIYYFLENTNTNEVHINENLVEKFKTWILHEDDDLLVINKPNGVSSQGGTVAGLCVDILAKAYFSEARITHRLDRETSGIMVLAKNKFTAREVTGLFANGEVLKKYYAVVRGNASAEKTITTDIQKDTKAQKMFVTNGSSCVTFYKTTAKNEKYSLLEVTPQTGKMHQIRVHLASVNLPIIGDEKYGGNLHERMFLHAFSISFDDKTFAAPIPKEFINLGFTI
jgi:23S rRNA pseudouridine955/2504/2580 synthase